MARTAITLAKAHNGKWTILGNPEDSLLEQKKNFRQMRGDKAHEKYIAVIYQESDSPAENIRLITPAEKEQQTAARAAALAEAGEKKSESPVKTEEQIAFEANEKAAAEANQ